MADAVSNNEQNGEEAGQQDVEKNQGKSGGDCTSTPKKVGGKVGRKGIQKTRGEKHGMSISCTGTSSGV